MDLPMPSPTSAPLPLSQYELLSFDVYGTLIEYKSHILQSFQPLLSRLPSNSPYHDTAPSSSIAGAASRGSLEFLKVFQSQEDAIKLDLAKRPRRFDEILLEIWYRIAIELNIETNETEARKFASKSNIASWPTFPGTLDALQALSKHYKLVALSNIDQYAWDITAASPESRLGDVNWFKVFTAEDFGHDFKRADDVKLETLLELCEEQGIAKEKVLHVAQSLGHDHAPAKRAGISSVWLVGDGLRWKGTGESKMAVEKGLVGYGWKFDSLKDFADEAERAFQDQSGK